MPRRAWEIVLAAALALALGWIVNQVLGKEIEHELQRLVAAHWAEDYGEKEDDAA